MNRTILISTCRALLVAAAALAPALSARAQDLYDTTVLRTFNITFHDANWLQLLQQNYASETPIGADLEVDGVVYPSVGVRIRGNTSYTQLPAGSQKFSLKILTDWVDPDQDLLGYSNLNLNNGFRDPTFCREVVFNNYLAQFVPNPRANHVLVTLNGQNWGVYVNVQQPNKKMLREYFASADGLRIRCANNPFGPGLTYVGMNPASYAMYEIQDDGGLASPVGALIAVCNAVTNEPLATWQNIDALFAIDPSIWTVVLENLLTDDDSYINKGCDFMTYRDPVDGRMHLLQRDANETFTQVNWTVTRNFTASNKPVLSHVLAVPELRQRYMAHYRTVLQDLDWSYFGPIFQAHRELIDAAVQADPKKLYTYTLFQNNFTGTVFMPYPGLAGGNIVGLQQFVNQRANFLGGNAELIAKGPNIVGVQASRSAPQPSDSVFITATVLPAGSPVAAVELHFRPTPTVPYARVPMLDDGLSGDGAAGDGVYGAQLPVAAVGGQVVTWYVAAVSANQYSSRSFLPRLAERGPVTLQYAAADSGIRITEWMYQGPSGEFLEITNLSDDPVDVTGWSIDDSNGVPGAYDISGFGTIQPGESVVVTESAAATFAAAWGLGPNVKVLGDLGNPAGNNLGRNDEINIYDADGGLVDRLTYGDQDFPGTIRTQNISGQACVEFIGINDIYGWELSAIGDIFGSWTASTGERGTPGFYAAPICSVVPGDLNGDGIVDGADLGILLGSWGPCAECADCPADLNGDCAVDGADLGVLLGAWS
ncbi:MAG TPA: CotH kinase family protein [Phycisphaerales bacterium]|nr:CotH kinase family protein [Phycisphaerales bacterium]HMP38186.1 CotH kinase family protein [Phycisphaerales bacterium]